MVAETRANPERDPILSQRQGVHSLSGGLPADMVTGQGQHSGRWAGHRGWGLGSV